MASLRAATERAPACPPAVIGALHARRGSLGAEARGRVLDLGPWGPPLDSYRSEAVESVTVVEPDPARASERQRHAAALGLELVVLDAVEAIDQHARYDTTLAVVALAGQADLPRAVSLVAATLAPKGSFVFVEPTLAPGALSALVAPLATFLPAAASLHLNRDVPSAVRAHGLTIIAIERFTMPTVIWPLRRFVHATARQIVASGEPTAPTVVATDGAS